VIQMASAGIVTLLRLTGTHWAICNLMQQRPVPSIAETLGLEIHGATGCKVAIGPFLKTDCAISQRAGWHQFRDAIGL
jgi:hypothetical protein